MNEAQQGRNEKACRTNASPINDDVVGGIQLHAFENSEKYSGWGAAQTDAKVAMGPGWLPGDVVQPGAYPIPGECNNFG